MKLQAHPVDQHNVFTNYGSDFVDVKGTKHQSSLVVTMTTVERWRPQSFAELCEDDFCGLLHYQPELILLGTGQQLRFPAQAMTQGLIAAGIGVEAMNVAALCRTFNILVGEGRAVVAALVFV